MRTSHIALTTALSTTISIAIPAAAHADEVYDENSVIIVTASTGYDEAEERANKTAGGTDVVSYQDYADKSPVSLRDTLAFSPGVYLQPRYGQEIRISIRGSGLSRGFHQRGLTLLQDGIPINLADDNGDFQELEPIFFDHLEVYRGANALRFGSGTLGGAVNGVTPTGKTAAGLYLRADAGSFDSYRGLVSYGIESEFVDAWAAVSADTSNGDREHSDRNSFRFHGNIGLKLSDNIKTRFYASFNNINQEIPGSLTREEVLTNPRQANVGNVAGDNARDIDSLRLQNRTSFDFGNTQLDVGIFLNVKSLYHPIFQVVDQETVDHGFFARLDHVAGPFEFTLGGEIRFGDVESKRFENIVGRRGALTFDADQKARTANIYGEIRYKPFDALTLVAGGIYADGYREQQENFNGSAGGPRDIFNRADFDEFSPKFGLLYDATSDIQFFANYSRSAEFPGFIELSQSSPFLPGGIFAPIEAQHAWTAEFGTRGRLGVVSWDLAAYRADVKDELLQFSTNQNFPAATFNAPKTRHQGIEAALTIEPTDWLRIRQVYQYSDFTFRNDVQFGNNRLPVVPKHVYRAEIRFGSDVLHIAPNIEWVPTAAFADYENAIRTSDYALLGLTAGAKLTDNFDLFLDIRNITKEKAIGDVSAIVSGGTANRTIFSPVERRAVFGGIRARF